MAGCGNNQTTQESTVSESAATTAATEAETTAAETSPFEESNSEALSWDMAEEILTHISDPEFPDYEAVSYTHLDVYKRQSISRIR